MSLLKRLNSETPGSTGSMSPRPSGPAPTPSTGNLTTGELFTRSTPSSTSNPSTGELFSPTQNISRQTTGLSESSQSARAKSPRSDNFNELKARVQNRLIAELDPRMDLGNAEEVRRTVEDTFASVLEAEGISLTRVERMRLFEAISAEILGFGPIEPLLKDDSVTEVMINGPKQVYVERAGRLELSDVAFQDDDHVMRVIDRIVSPLGRRIDESSPTVDARLPDGSRVNAIIPPIALNGPTVTIRKFSKDPFTVDDLIRFGTFTAEMATFMKACVEARLNIIVSGGTGSGKTTFLNVLSSFIPADERIVTIENAAELQLRQEHVVRLESRPANIEGKGEITIRDLVINALRMRPERIVVGECRGGEALDMLQAMNTGHDGSMTTAHANTPRDALSRLETMVLMAGMDLPVRAIREQVASAVDLIIQQERLKDGTRKITGITEVQGMEGDVIVMQDIFSFQQSGIENGKIVGRMKPTGIRPKFMPRFEVANIYLPPNIFGAGMVAF
ncbi:MAG: CpaF family protein [Thermomicrobiales bacterium]